MADWVIAALQPEDHAEALRLLRETGAEQRRPVPIEPVPPATGWVARDGDGRFAGLASGLDKPGRTKIRIAVAADLRRRGCGTALLAAVSKAAIKSPIVYGWAVRYSAGEGFLESRMQRHHDDEIWSVLDRSATFPERKEGKPVPGLTLSAEVGQPDFAEARPLEDGSHRLAAIDGTGRTAGYTEISRAGAQLYTVVDPAWRGRGVALWLKTTILAALPAEIRYVTTENNAGNDPMLAVNRRLGFRPYQHHVAWASDQSFAPR